mmetsp:Transcript_51127/g.120014  ORF Transcript_51127/g.120014 Transcript_51127/m.120014 type:complete len:321 (-) Transcript_51127:6-968(-)
MPLSLLNDLVHVWRRGAPPPRLRPPRTQPWCRAHVRSLEAPFPAWQTSLHHEPLALLGLKPPGDLGLHGAHVALCPRDPHPPNIAGHLHCDRFLLFVVVLLHLGVRVRVRVLLLLPSRHSPLLRPRADRASTIDSRRIGMGTPRCESELGDVGWVEMRRMLHLAPVQFQPLSTLPQHLLLSVERVAIEIVAQCIVHLHHARLWDTSTWVQPRLCHHLLDTLPLFIEVGRMPQMGRCLDVLRPRRQPPSPLVTVVCVGVGVRLWGHSTSTRRRITAGISSSSSSPGKCSLRCSSIKASNAFGSVKRCPNDRRAFSRSVSLG